MSDLNGFEKFDALMTEFAPKLIEPHIAKMQEEGKSYIEQRTAGFIIFNGYTEIKKSYDSLHLINKFISITPTVEDGINYSNYLEYHVHNYLQEMFILKERLNKYATLIQRKYKKTQNKEFLETLIPPLFKIIGSFLDCITAENSGVRNKHVHSKRFMDEELSWLSSTIFLAEFDEKFEIESKNAYVIAQKKWYNLIEVNNQELLKLFDVYFNTIYTVITINDKVNLPKSSR